MPARGEVVHHPSGIEFEVLDADPRRIKRLRVRAAAAPRRAPDAGRRALGPAASRATGLRSPAAAAWAAPARRCGRPGGLARRGSPALALPPLAPLAAALLGFAVLLHLLRRARGAAAPRFALGWWFGFGHFLVGLYWIAIAFFIDAERFGWAVPAVLLLCAGIALYPALAACAARCCTAGAARPRRRSPWRSPGSLSEAGCAGICSPAFPGT